MPEPWQRVVRLNVLGNCKYFKSSKPNEALQTLTGVDRDNDYKDLCPNMVIARNFTQHMRAYGREFVEGRDQTMGASTDMGKSRRLPSEPVPSLTQHPGNVCYEVPGFHCAFSVGTEDPKIQPHTPAFAAAAGTKLALERALDCGKGMSATAYSLLASAEMVAEAWKEFHREIKSEVKL